MTELTAGTFLIGGLRLQLFMLRCHRVARPVQVLVAARRLAALMATLTLQVIGRAVSGNPRS